MTVFQIRFSSFLPVLFFLTNMATGRRTVTVDLVMSTEPEFDLSTTPKYRTSCVGGIAGLTNTSVLVQYRLYEGDLEEWIFLDEVNISAVSANSITSSQFELPQNGSARGVQFRFLQLEHGGTGCNCWEVMHVTVSLALSDPPVLRQLAMGNFENINHVKCLVQGLENDGEEKFCFSFANEARGAITQVFFFSNDPGVDTHLCPGESRSELITPKGSTLPENCNTMTPRMEVSYQLVVDGISDDCDGIESPDEAIEFALRTTSHWIPLRITYGAEGGTLVRGYTVQTTSRTSGLKVMVHVYICGDLLYNISEIQFRWMGTADLDSESKERDDVWALGNVTVNLIVENQTLKIFRDSFGTNFNESLWMGPRGGSVTCTRCTESFPCSNNFLTFGANDGRTRGRQVSRIALTRSILLKGLLDVQPFSTQEQPLPSTTQEQPLPSTTQEQLLPSTTQEQLLPSTTQEQPLPSTAQEQPLPYSSLEEAKSLITERISSNQMLQNISQAEPLDAVNMLNAREEAGDPAVVVYLLGKSLNKLTPADNNDTGQFIEGFLEVSNTVLITDAGIVDEAVTGSSFLTVMDRLAFEVIPGTGNQTSGNIVVATKELEVATEEYQISTIDSKELVNESSMFPKMTVEVPSTLVRDLVNRTGAVIRAVSFLYYDVERLFPRGLPGDENNTVLWSGIVSTALQCGAVKCPTDVTLTMKTPVGVRIAIKHKLVTNANTVCVFWNFVEGDENTILSVGEWSRKGCMKNDILSSNTMTVCECNHLTHFAILLSAAPPNLSEPIVLSLEVVGYVGVSVSLVAMALTITTFVMLKSLHNMRNFIHINLCISLGIAQIIFVAGIDQSGGDHVPIHCQFIAVLLHYFFLVSFMWMLMEGVVLYVVLVRVFIKRTKLYMLAFTLTSYGLPLFYLGLLTLPLGFALPTQPNYGYRTACFLNPGSRFIWAIIVPVILIVTVNLVFFVIVARIMWKHQKKMSDNTTAGNAKKWLRSAVFLVVIMGLTWIFGVLIVEVEELVALAYIYTILVAFQGVFIFLIFVPLSKQVRDSYSKWWKARVNESDFLSKYFSTSVSLNLSVTKGTGMPSSNAGAILEMNSKDDIACKGSHSYSPKANYENNCITFTNIEQ